MGRKNSFSKNGFQFAAATQLERLINNFDNEYLKDFSLFKALDRQDIVAYLAKSHIEFILIHPFREGNGRIGRLLIDSMAVRLGYGLLDYSLWDENKEYYFRSIQAGVSGQYHYLVRLINDILPY